MNRKVYQREWQRAYREKNRDKYNAYHRNYRRKNKSKWLETQIRSMEKQLKALKETEEEQRQ